MVTLFVSDLDQMTMLEYELSRLGIKYDKQQDYDRYGLGLPYLKVYDVPLDEQRAFNWIKENYE